MPDLDLNEQPPVDGDEAAFRAEALLPEQKSFDDVFDGLLEKAQRKGAANAVLDTSDGSEAVAAIAPTNGRLEKVIFRRHADGRRTMTESIHRDKVLHTTHLEPDGSFSFSSSRPGEQRTGLNGETLPEESGSYRPATVKEKQRFADTLRYPKPAMLGLEKLNRSRINVKQGHLRLVG